MRNDPGGRKFQFSGAGVVPALQPVKYVGKDRRSLKFCLVVFGSIALVSLRARGSSLRQHSRQQARPSILTIAVRFVRCRQTGELYAVVKFVVVVVVLTLTRIIKSVVTGQAPVHSGAEEYPREKHTQPKVVHAYITADAIHASARII